MLFSALKNQDIPFLVLPREETVGFSKKNNFENKKKSFDSFADDFFSEKFLQNKKLDAENVYHLRTVLRKTNEQEILLGDGKGNIALAKTDKQNRITEIFKTIKIPPKNTQVHLLQAMPKKKSMETILQKTGELGVSSLTFFLSEHAKSNISKQEQKMFEDTEKTQEKQNSQSRQIRIEKIVRSACMQSRNPFVPQVIFNTNSLQENIAEKEMFCENVHEDFFKTKETMQSSEQKSACMFLWGDWLKENIHTDNITTNNQEEDFSKSSSIILKKENGDSEGIIPQKQHREQEYKKEKGKINFNAHNIYFINGPEGGWSKQEYNYLKSRFRSVVLSDNVLRTETAAISAISVLYFFTGNNFSVHNTNNLF